jgi:Uma2 family endonuclease
MAINIRPAPPAAPEASGTQSESISSRLLAPDDGRSVSEAEYWRDFYDRGDFSYEWNNGVLEAKPVGDYVKYLLYVWFVDILKDFLHVNPIARMIGLEMGFRLALPRKVTIRRPDLGVVLHTNPVPLGDYDRTYGGIFDLCVESLSDSDQREVDRDTIIKKEEYALAGVSEYYILDDQGVETVFYRLTPQGIYQPIQPNEQGVIRSSVLPGFQFRLADLYRQPLPHLLVDDPVYRDFVSPYFRAERQRAERAEKALILKEREVADQQQEIARLAAKLRAAGIAPDEI